ncbi:MAG: FtsW/RodA/SpoVE family cell cycle protein [Clostridia bacterium]|nr:FtsW/RodA/SpoVE family cell cycle protein [Clostridia bacterium]
MLAFGRCVKKVFSRMDPILFGATTFLSLMSILTVFGAVDNFGKSKLVMQIAMTLAGMVAVLILANLDYRFFVDRFHWVMLIGSAALLAITLLFGNSGENIETANRSWLRFPVVGIAIQPSEFVKITFLCTFARHLDLVKAKINRPLTLLGVIAHAGLIVGLILLSGDLGVALVYLGIIAVMLFCAGLSVWYFVGALVILVIAFPFLWDFLKPYQQNRIIIGFQPELDPNDVGRQPLLSRETIAGGGLFGVGLFGGGRYEILAASHTDFIFATVCEKFGFVGGALVVIALVVLAIRLLWISYRCRDGVGRLICCGIAAIIIIQSLENLWMCMAMVPVVGITLPFMSCGGSSVFALYVLMGLAHSTASREKKFFFSGRSE